MSSPLRSMHLVIRCGILPTKFTRYERVISSQTSWIILSNSFKFWGFFFSTAFFMIPQMFSIGFRSGELAGQSETVQWLEANHSRDDLEVWQVAPSCWNINPFGWSSWRLGQAFSRVSWYFWLFMVPRVKISLDFPLVLIAPQTITLGLNFGRPICGLVLLIFLPGP